MTWNATITVLTSIFGSIVLVSALYFLHAYLVPHLRQPTEKPDITLPQLQRCPDHRLQESLYSLPSLNYIDPRNSIADTDLRSSRWSTYLQDLSRPTSPKSVSLPRSPAMHFRPCSYQSEKSIHHGRNISASTVVECVPRSTSKMLEATWQEQGSGQRSKTKPSVLTLEPQRSHVDNRCGRARSKSDTVVLTQKGLLAHSHEKLYGFVHAGDLSSPTTSTSSGSTLLPSPRTPQQELRSGSAIRSEEPAGKESPVHRYWCSVDHSSLEA